MTPAATISTTDVTIVVPLDGSEVAARAIPVAVRLARGVDADVHLITTSFDADVSDEEARLAAQATATGLPRTRSSVLRKVFPARGIVETVEAQPNGVLCLTTRGRGAVAELLLGSVSDEVLRDTTRPVVLVGPACDVEAVAGARSLVIAVDGSAGSLDVVPVASAWARALPLEVRLVTVEPHGLPDEAYDPATSKVLTTAAGILEAAGVPFERHLLVSAHPGDALVGFASGSPAGLVAMGMHGTGPAGAALGRVARHVVRHSSSPVLTRRTAH